MKRKFIIGTLLAVALTLVVPMTRVNAAISQAYDYDYGYFWWLSNDPNYYDYDSGGYHQSWGSSPKGSPVRYGNWCQLLSWDSYYCYSRHWSSDYSASVYASNFPGAPPQRAGLESIYNYSSAPFYDGAGSANNPGPSYWQTPPWHDGSGVANNYRKVVIESYRRPRPQFYTWTLSGQQYIDGSGVYWAKPGTAMKFNVGGYDPEGKMKYIYGRLSGSGIDNRDYHDFDASGTSHTVFQSDGGNYFTGVSETACPSDRSACAVNWYFTTPSDGKSVNISSYIYNQKGLPEYISSTNKGVSPSYHEFYTLKSDGKAPTGTPSVTFLDNYTICHLHVDGVSDNGGSGVKQLKAIISTPSNPINTITVTLTKDVSGNYVTPDIDLKTLLNQSFNISVVVTAEDNVGNITNLYSNTQYLPVATLTDFTITDIKDPEWHNVFYNADESSKNVGFVPSQLPVDNTSNSYYQNAEIKKGYRFYFRLRSTGLAGATDYINIIPTWYYWDGVTRTLVDMYYKLDDSTYIKAGTAQDTMSILYYTNHLIDSDDDTSISVGNFTNMVIPTGLRTIVGNDQYWFGTYFVPANSIFVPSGLNPDDSNILKKNNIIINFKIDGISNVYAGKQIDYDSQWGKNQWIKEGSPKNFKYKFGDIILFDNSKSALDDFTTRTLR